MIGEREESLAEFACVRAALCIGRLFDGGNHSDGLAVIGEDSDLALPGVPRELSEASLGYPNADRPHGYPSIPDASERESTWLRGVTTFCLDRAAGSRL